MVARAGRRSRGPIRRAFDRPPASRFHDGGDLCGSRRRRPTPATPAAAAAAQRPPHRTGSQHNQRAETGKVAGHDQGIFFFFLDIILVYIYYRAHRKGGVNLEGGGFKVIAWLH